MPRVIPAPETWLPKPAQGFEAMIPFTSPGYKRPARPTYRRRTLDDEARLRGDRCRRRARNIATTRRETPAEIVADGNAETPRTEADPDKSETADPDPADSSFPPCPRCGGPVTDVWSTGPHSHNAAPCGCPLTADEVKSL